ncbi:related to replication protein CDC23 [Rhynchosporium graminicola]|uniref:Related to replication protein CDC23 n=1 Tax=Rhynchosporium graminicola TaxID=2792576 RepID=A0A1E1JV51_9HELO|nr:related to replication protein CDC23 [Rhynchosporium commune]
MSQPLANPEWPPRSPHDVLLSTPGGRDRLRRLAERTSLSPSPSKRPSSMRKMPKDLLKTELEDDEDEDEETLQLQLQEIQARLKLKKLQKKAKHVPESESDPLRSDPAQLTRVSSAAASRARSRVAGLRRERLEEARVQPEIHVPVSPIRRAQPPPVQRSPGRVLLGIDKGLRGSDISLKRAPSLRKRDEISQEMLAGPFLQRAGSQASSRAQGTATPANTASNGDRPKSFSERMAAVRSEELERKERQERIRKNRSTGFDIDHEKMQRFKENAVELPDNSRVAPDFTRDEVLGTKVKFSSKSAPNLRPAIRSISKDHTSSLQSRTDLRASAGSSKPASRRAPDMARNPQEVTESEADASQFEPYSAQHLSRRIVPHPELTRILTGKKAFLIPDLLKVVKAPDFQSPEIEEDMVVFGIISKKTEPKTHQPNPSAKNQNRGKFMVMALTDLKWELDLFLFDTAFDKFWKYTPGTIIAILNPQIMPPPKGKEATGKFSLTLNSNADTILEVGTARDLGYCKSVKKDGNTCDSWVDRRHTEFCDYHINLTLNKTHSNRMEVNTMGFGKGRYATGGGGGGEDSGKFTSGSNRYSKYKTKQEKEEEKITRYDRGTHSQIYIGKRSTVNMLDDVDFDPDAFHRGSTKEERMTRRILAQEKERDLERKLADMGSGQGAEYMRRRDPATLPRSELYSSSQAEPPPDAGKLGLLGGKADDVSLSPIKRKRTNTVSSSAAVGWGSDLTRQLGKMKNGENIVKDGQPPIKKKKTRFVTEKGIREAGRESFGGEVVEKANNDLNDSDDDLDIVRE